MIKYIIYVFIVQKMVHMAFKSNYIADDNAFSIVNLFETSRPERLKS